MEISLLITRSTTHLVRRVVNLLCGSEGASEDSQCPDLDMLTVHFITDNSRTQVVVLWGTLLLLERLPKCASFHSVLYVLHCIHFILLCCCFMLTVFLTCVYFLHFFLCTSVNTSKTNFHCFLQGTIKFF